MLLRKEVEAEPYWIWNAFVDLIATERYEELTPEQRPAHLAFWYDAEVQNGGHLQYFENRGVERLDETIHALDALGAPCHAKVLHEVGKAWQWRARGKLTSAAKFVERARLGEFDVFDARFHACEPSVEACLERHLELHRKYFVTIR